MAASGRSEAYDLSLFETKKQNIIDMPVSARQQKEQARRTKLQSILNVAVMTLVAALVVGVLAMTIAARAQLTEMNTKISQKQEQLNELTAETKRLNSELAARTSAQSVEQYTQQNGMQKMESDQIEYITVQVNGAQSEQKAKPGFFESVWSGITNFFGKLAYETK